MVAVGKLCKQKKQKNKENSTDKKNIIKRSPTLFMHSYLRIKLCAAFFSLLITTSLLPCKDVWINGTGPFNKIAWCWIPAVAARERRQEFPPAGQERRILFSQGSFIFVR